MGSVCALYRWPGGRRLHVVPSGETSEAVPYVRKPYTFRSSAHVIVRLSAAVLTIAMVSYLAMATGLGTTYVPIHDHAPDASVYKFFREVYWARECPANRILPHITPRFLLRYVLSILRTPTTNYVQDTLTGFSPLLSS